jgi:hypothetical protein
MSRPKTLLLCFKGWSVLRIPTDPDPTDEPRGASGYTYAFAGEPNLDRIIRFQPQTTPQNVRPGSPYEWGVFINQARVLMDDGPGTNVDGLLGASVDLCGEPKLENRNWLLTLPGWEPIVPFDLQIKKNELELRRLAPLDDKPSPYWKKPEDVLMNQAAKGVYYEHETIGTATGIWDAQLLRQQRKATLQKLLENERDPIARSCLESRLYENQIALDNVNDRRVQAHYAVERFDFSINGANAIVPRLPGLPALDAKSDWGVSFWCGAWDCDLLAMYVQGSLQVPFLGGS